MTDDQPIRTVLCRWAAALACSVGLCLFWLSVVRAVAVLVAG